MDEEEGEEDQEEEWEVSPVTSERWTLIGAPEERGAGSD